MIQPEFTTIVVLIDHLMTIDYVHQLFMFLIWHQQQMFYWQKALKSITNVRF